MHLLYARFFTKVVRDLGLIDFGEPFLRLFNQGTVLSDHMKMSKSRGNVIAPDEYVKDLGADVVRLYLMFMGPWEGGGDWSDSGINGVARWGEPPLGPLPEGHRYVARGRGRFRSRRHPQDAPDHPRRHREPGALQVQHRPRLDDGADQRDVPRLRRRRVSRRAWSEAVESLLLLSRRWARTSRGALGAHGAPVQRPQPAPARVGRSARRHRGGHARRAGERKVRDRIPVPASISEGDAKEAALTSEKVVAYTEGKQVDKIVFVPGRYLVRVVVKG